MAYLHNGNGDGKGKQVILVTSGAVAFGKQRIKHELLLSQSMRATLHNGKNHHNVMISPCTMSMYCVCMCVCVYVCACVCVVLMCE